MASDLFKKYIWLADTIRRAGPITFAEINERWQRSTLSGGKRLALRTFHNHREAIEELFGIRIACDDRTNRYYITNSDDLQRDSMANWLLDSFSVSNMLRETQSLRDRILVENIPSAKSFLIDILEAMRENRQIGVTYQPFYGDTPFELTLRPLFVKLYERRWYLYADKPHEAKIKLYALDRMQAVRLTEKRFTPPADLDPGDLSVRRLRRGCLRRHQTLYDPDPRLRRRAEILADTAPARFATGDRNDGRLCRFRISGHSYLRVLPDRIGTAHRYRGTVADRRAK